VTTVDLEINKMLQSIKVVNHRVDQVNVRSNDSHEEFSERLYQLTRTIARTITGANLTALDCEINKMWQAVKVVNHRVDQVNVNSNNFYDKFIERLSQLNETIARTIIPANVTALEVDINEMQHSIKVVNDRVDQVIVEFDDFHGGFIDRKTAVSMFQPKLELKKRAKATAQ